MDRTEFLQLAISPSKDIESPPAPITPFADWDFYYTNGPIDWTSSAGGGVPASVTVPSGFVTDLASIPKAFWSFLSPQARYTYPAVIHDYLYWFQPCDRAIADQVLKLAMQDMGVKPATAFTIFGAVRVEGDDAWAANRRARTDGEKRVLKRFPTSVKTTWVEWKLQPDNFVQT